MSNISFCSSLSEDCLKPFPASEKFYFNKVSSQYTLNVAMRKINLSDGGSIVIYDTSGPYTDDKTVIDIHKGLRPIRRGWIDLRNDTQVIDKNTQFKCDRRCSIDGRAVTQLAYAKRRVRDEHEITSRTCCNFNIYFLMIKYTKIVGPFLWIQEIQ